MHAHTNARVHTHTHTKHRYMHTHTDHLDYIPVKAMTFNYKSNFKFITSRQFIW